VTSDEFNKLLETLGYGPKDYPPNGRLDHWPSGKLFQQVDYYWVRDFACRLASQIVGAKTSAPSEGDAKT